MLVYDRTTDSAERLDRRFGSVPVRFSAEPPNLLAETSNFHTKFEAQSTKLNALINIALILASLLAIIRLLYRQ